MARSRQTRRVAPWQTALQWLCIRNATTAQQVTELTAYFDHTPLQKEEDSLKRLPLHCAAIHQTGELAVEVVKVLLALYPQAAQHKDGSGWLPLHFAANNQSGDHGVTVLTALLVAFPQAAQQRAGRHGLPVDVARRSNASSSSCIALLQAAAEGRWQPPPITSGNPVTAWNTLLFRQSPAPFLFHYYYCSTAHEET